MKILIVEDDHVYRQTLMRSLSKKQFNCHGAENCNDALLMCRQLLPDVVLLDMHLGNETSLKIVKLLRAIKVDMKIILLTGYASIATAVDAIKLGADEYLAKPVDIQTLVKVINGTEIETSELEQTATLSSQQLEWEHIQQVLKVNNGNVSAAARQLSMHRRTLQRKLKKRPNLVKS